MGEDFLNSSLCIWLSKTFESLHPPQNLFDLADGEFLNKTMASIAPERFTMSRVNKDVGDDTKSRIDNLNFLLKNLIFYYEEILNCYIIAKLPDIRAIGTHPQSYISAVELEKIFTLILGIAFQCDNKSMYIEQVRELPEEIQSEIMNKLLEIKESDSLVIQSFIEPENMDKNVVDSLCHSVLRTVHCLSSERNDVHEKYIRASQERDEYLMLQQNNRGRRSTISINDSFSESKDGSRPTTPAYNTEIMELRAKLLNYEDELEAKTETIEKLKDESTVYVDQITRLKTEYRTLYDDAQSARIYRDEIDVLRCKAEKLDKYEADISKYRDKLEDMEYLKNRVKELKNNNDQLNEMNELLKEELVNSEQINKALIAEEEKNLKLRSMLEELNAQKEYGDRLIQDLTNQKKQVELELKHSANMISQMQTEIDELTNSNNEIRMALLEKDGAPDSMKFVNIEKELSHDNKGETPIINRRRSTIRETSKDDFNDVLSTKLKRLEMDNLHLKTQVEKLKNTDAKLQALEQKSEKDKLVLTTNKSEITRLQEELSLGKSKIDNMQCKIDEAHSILKEIGYDTDKLGEVRPLSDREKFLKYEERLRQSLNHSLKMKEERISVLEDRVGENIAQNDGLRQELSIVKKQNKSYQKKNKSLQQSLDASLSSISSTPNRRISKGSQYDHAVSLSSTPIKQRSSVSVALSPGVSLSSTPIKQRSSVSVALSPGVCNISSIDVKGQQQQNESKERKSEILDVTLDESVSLSERSVQFQLFKQDLMELKEENDQLFLDKERLEQEVQELQTERRSHLIEIQNLRQQNLDLKHEADDVTRENKKMRLRLEEIEIEFSELEENNEKLKERFEEVENHKQYVTRQCNKLLMQNQELLIKTIEEQEKTREEQRVYQDQILSMKQNNQQLSLTLAMKQHSNESAKKKPFYKQIFSKNKKSKSKDEVMKGTPHIDEYLDQLSIDSDRLTPPEYDNGFYRDNQFLDSDGSSRTMSGDGHLERGTSLNSLGRAGISADMSHSSAAAPLGTMGRLTDATTAFSYRNPGITRTLSTDSERRHNIPEKTDHVTPKRQGSLRLKSKSDSFDLTPRVEPRSMARPLPPGTHQSNSTVHDLPSRVLHPQDHNTDHRAQLNHSGAPDHHSRAPLNHSALSSLHYTTAKAAHEQSQRSMSAEPSAFRQYNTSSLIPNIPPRIQHPDSLSRHSADSHSRQGSIGHRADRGHMDNSDCRPRSSRSSVSESYSQRGLHNEDTQNSSYYEYGCV